MKFPVKSIVLQGIIIWYLVENTPKLKSFLF